MKTLPVLSKSVAFTSTNVPKFMGVTRWDQYRQVFDAIVWSNGLNDATVALQLLSHLEGDALIVTLLVPKIKADYRRQFERTTRQEGEDTSTFDIVLEIFVVNVFGDMGPTHDFS